jgi:hypothetical protein
MFAGLKLEAGLPVTAGKEERCTVIVETPAIPVDR